MLGRSLSCCNLKGARPEVYLIPRLGSLFRFEGGSEGLSTGVPEDLSSSMTIMSGLLFSDVLLKPGGRFLCSIPR